MAGVPRLECVPWEAVGPEQAWGGDLAWRLASAPSDRWPCLHGSTQSQLLVAYLPVHVL